MYSGTERERGNERGREEPERNENENVSSSFSVSRLVCALFSPPPLSSSPLSSSNISFFFFFFLLHSYAKVVPTTLDASVVGGRASREADARIRDAEGGSLPPSPPSPSSSSAAAAFPLHAVHTYQYSISEKFTPLDPKAPSIPTVSLSYDMSPLALSLSRPRTPLAHAAVRLAAVGGGARALASFFGALVHFVAGRRRRGGGDGRRGEREAEQRRR